MKIILLITFLIVMGCSKIDICDPTNYPDPPFGEPDITEIRDEKYYVRVTYIYFCLAEKYIEITYTNHEDICWHKDMIIKENELCN